MLALSRRLRKLCSWHNRSPKKYYDDFIELNKQKLGKNNVLKVGVTYVIPPVKKSTTTSAKTTPAKNTGAKNTTSEGAGTKQASSKAKSTKIGTTINEPLCVQAGWTPKKGEPRVLPIYQSPGNFSA